MVEYYRLSSDLQDRSHIRFGYARRSTSTSLIAGSVGLGWTPSYPSARPSPRTATVVSARVICSEGCFEEIVRCCVVVGLVDGTGAAVDGSVVEADASCERRLPGDRLPEAWSNRESQAQPVRAYLDALDAASVPARDEPKQAAPKHLSETDPQAAWSVNTGAGASVMRPTTWSTPPMR